MGGLQLMAPRLPRRWRLAGWVALGAMLSTLTISAQQHVRINGATTSATFGQTSFTSPIVSIGTRTGPGLLLLANSTSDSRPPLLMVKPDGTTAATLIGTSGQIVTHAWITLLGNKANVGTVDAAGNFTNQDATGTGISTMLDVLSDTTAAAVLKTANLGGAYPLIVLDHSANYVFGIDEPGSLQWGAGATYVSLDTGLGRHSARALEINSTVLGTYGDLFARAGTWTTLALANSVTAGLTAINSTPATVGATVQYSPALQLWGTAWDTTASQTSMWSIHNQPATAATPTSRLFFAHSLNGAAFVTGMTLSDAGVMTLTASLTINSGNVNLANGTFIRWNGGSGAKITSGADAQFILENNAANAGFGIDTSTDGVARFRVRAQNADAQVQGASVRGTAVAFASVPTPVEGMMVAVTDSSTATWGATITGSGANHVLAYYNGTNWTVAGK